MAPTIMRYRVHVSRLPGGEFLATCLEPQCSGKGGTQVEALDRITAELRYLVELCPCTTLGSRETVDVEVASQPEKER